VFGPGSTCLYARLAESDHAIRHVSWLGKTVPLDGTAIGAALLGRCNARGYVSTRHTMEDNTTAIAAPVYWPVSTVTAALSVVGPTFRISEAKMRSIGKLLVAHAAELASELGIPARESQGGPLRRAVAEHAAYLV
jgi:DNA-binding IclR family transcriptional regulator